VLQEVYGDDFSMVSLISEYAAYDDMTSRAARISLFKPKTEVVQLPLAECNANTPAHKQAKGVDVDQGGDCVDDDDDSPLSPKCASTRPHTPHRHAPPQPRCVEHHTRAHWRKRTAHTSTLRGALLLPAAIRSRKIVNATAKKVRQERQPEFESLKMQGDRIEANS
jgi:hypothetical protein